MTVPYFGVQAFLPDSDEYRDAERRQVRALLPKLIATERPDLILSRERQSVTVGIAELAREHGVPWVLLSRGYPLVAIMNDAYPEALAARALEEYATASLVITPGRHMAEGLHRLGIPRADHDSERHRPGGLRAASEGPALLDDSGSGECE